MYPSGLSDTGEVGMRKKSKAPDSRCQRIRRQSIDKFLAHIRKNKCKECIEFLESEIRYSELDSLFARRSAAYGRWTALLKERRFEDLSKTAAGQDRQESDAVPQRGPLRGERGRWEGDSLRKATRRYAEMNIPESRDPHAGKVILVIM